MPRLLRDTKQVVPRGQRLTKTFLTCPGRVVLRGGRVDAPGMQRRMAFGLGTVAGMPTHGSGLDWWVEGGVWGGVCAGKVWRVSRCDVGARRRS